MLGYQHLKNYLLSILIVWALNNWLNVMLWWMPFCLIPAFIIDPDIDDKIQKMIAESPLVKFLKAKELVEGKMLHRHLFTHSILFPMTIYYSIRPFICIINPFMTALWFFFPVYIHLLCDFKFISVAKTLIEDEKQKKSGNKNYEGSISVGGTYLYSIEPFYHKRLPFYVTLTIMIINIIIIPLYLIGLYYGII